MYDKWAERRGTLLRDLHMAELIAKGLDITLWHLLAGARLEGFKKRERN